MKGGTGFRHDFIFVILTELPGAITQTRGPYTCLKELQAGIPRRCIRGRQSWLACVAKSSFFVLARLSHNSDEDGQTSAEITETR